jgi:hypothetical protein
MKLLKELRLSVHGHSHGRAMIDSHPLEPMDLVDDGLGRSDQIGRNLMDRITARMRKRHAMRD